MYLYQWYTTGHCLLADIAAASTEWQNWEKAIHQVCYFTFIKIFHVIVTTSKVEGMCLYQDSSFKKENKSN